MKKALLLLLWLVPSLMWAQETMQYRYWFDQAYDTAINGSTYTNTVDMDVDTKALPLGVHSINCQMYNSAKESSVVHTAFFYRGDHSKRTVKAYLDGNLVETQEKPDNGTSISLNLNTASIRPGLHSVLITVEDGIGTHMPTAKYLFLKVKATEGNKTLRFLVDGKLIDSQNVSAGETSVRCNIATDSLSIGIHSLAVLLVNGDEECTYTASSFFAKVPTDEDFKSLNLCYTIDNDADKIEKCTVTDSIAYADLDMSSLEEGEHTITFLATNGKGYVTQTMSASFIKVKAGTGIDGVMIYNPNGNPQNVYTLDGILISKDGTKNLPDGIYIQGKRKIVVRNSSSSFMTK